MGENRGHFYRALTIVLKRMSSPDDNVLLFAG